jgi:L-threonylcarbamoyladenylate synthase
MAIIGTDISLAIKLLKEGKPIGIPTETVYGLAANAFDEIAISSIFTIKQRPKFDPLIVHTYSLDALTDFVEHFPSPLAKLAQKFMPGPLTLLLEKKDVISDLVTAGSSLVAVRIPAHEMALQLLKHLDFPLAAPSANPFGYISPTNAQHVADQLGDKIDYILDGGQCNIGLESTILGLENDTITVYRKGGLSIEKIKSVVGNKIEIKQHSTSNPAAPGMLLTHYAPKTKVVIAQPGEYAIKYGNNIGVISFSKAQEYVDIKNQIILSSSNNYSEAARNLFSGMRHLDALNLDTIVVYLLPDEDLGMAINDKLNRAAAK